MPRLLSNASSSFSTVDIAWTATYGPLLAVALERSIPDFQARVAEGSVARLRVRGSEGDDDEAPTTQRVRVRWRRPGEWREDVSWGPGPDDLLVMIVNGADALSYVPGTGVMHSSRAHAGLADRLRRTVGLQLPLSRFGLPDRLRQNPLLDPSFLASGWTLTPSGTARHAERYAVRVHAVRAGGAGSELWEFIDQYELLVDAERGVLLRCAAIVDGVEAGVLSVDTVRFDEPLLDETFSFEAPRGTRIVPFA